MQKDFRNGSDTSTSNRRPSISTSVEIPISIQCQLQFHSNWLRRTREMPWIWHRAYLRHRKQEFICSHSQGWRHFQQLHHHLKSIIYKLVFIWTGVLSGRLELKTQTPTIINGVHCRPCNRSWTWIRVIKSGWRLLTCHQRRIWLTVLGTPPISRVSCCKRKLGRPLIEMFFFVPCI